MAVFVFSLNSSFLYAFCMSVTWFLLFLVRKFLKCLVITVVWTYVGVKYSKAVWDLSECRKLIFTSYVHTHTHTNTHAWSRMLPVLMCVYQPVLLHQPAQYQGSPAVCSWRIPTPPSGSRSSLSCLHHKRAEETVSCISCPPTASVTHTDLLWNCTESEDFASNASFPGGISGSGICATG